METGQVLRVSSDRQEEPGIELGTPGYKASGLSTTPRWLLKFGGYKTTSISEVALTKLNTEKFNSSRAITCHESVT